MDLLGGLGNPTQILESFKNEAIKILNEIATKQADELVQGIIREQVTKNMDTIFNSGYVQQTAASAFNSAIYPEYIKRLKNLEAFMKVSAEQDNGLREKINALPVDKRTPDEIIKVIHEWADGLEPKIADIQSKMVGPKNTDFNVVGNISDILYGDRQQEDINNEKIEKANSISTPEQTAVSTPEPNVVSKSIFSNFKNPFAKKTGGKQRTKRVQYRRRRRTYKSY